MNRLIFLVLLSFQFIFNGAVYAAEPLGRLFSTPEERSHLDSLREAKKNQPMESETVVEQNVIERRPLVLPEVINMQGYVKRNDGKDSTVWINGEAMQENTGNKDVRVGKLPANSNHIPIRIPANGQQLSLKAGQVYDPESNRIRESRSYNVQDGSSGRIGDDVLE
jgi:hypothetical protein